MRVIRILVLALFAFGLLVQGPAYAAVQPAAPAAMSSHCAEMTKSEGAPSQKPERGCCGDMQACLFGMSCMTAFFVPNAVDSLAPNLAGETLYTSFDTTALSAAGRGPEPPPPQLYS